MFPTPTPFPDMSSQMPIDIPDVNAWEFADDAVQTWNSAAEFGLPQVMQAFILILIITGIIMLLITMGKQLTDESE